MSRKSRDPVFYELEKISQKDLKSYRKRSKNLNDYFQEHFNYFADQRRRVFNTLLDSVRRKSEKYRFLDYKRAASFKYCTSPLSARGSILSTTGGRFNIGSISPNIPKFGSLYVAEDIETAVREFHQIQTSNVNDGLTGYDLSLLGQKSFCVVAVEGEFEQVLDLSDKSSLSSFFGAVKRIKLPKELKAKAKMIKVDPHPEIKTVTQLYNSIFELDYQRNSMLFDLPSNSQILGHIVYEAGIQAIKYPSKFTGKSCLAIFPDNFENTESYVKIADSAPEGVSKENFYIDKSNFRNFT